MNGVYNKRYLQFAKQYKKSGRESGVRPGNVACRGKKISDQLNTSPQLCCVAAPHPIAQKLECQCIVVSQKVEFILT